MSAPVRLQGYYAAPSVQGNTLAFVCEEDLWLTRFAGGGGSDCAMPQRLTVEGSAASPALSPDGQWLAFSCDATSTYEVHVMPAAGGEAKRLTHLGADSVICGWTPDSRAILFHSNAGRPMEHERALFCVSVAGGASEEVPVGPATNLSRDTTSAREFLARHADDAHLSEWKGYQGGRVAQIWVRDGREAPWARLALPHQRALTSHTLLCRTASPTPSAPLAAAKPRQTINPSSPAWWRGRIAFISDHKGRGNVFSVTPAGDDLTQHSFHAECVAVPPRPLAPVLLTSRVLPPPPSLRCCPNCVRCAIRYYARNLSGDGETLVWQHGGDLWRLADREGPAQRLVVPWQSPRQLRIPRHVAPSGFVEEVALSAHGRYLTVIARGQGHAMPPHGGPSLRVGPTKGRFSDASYRANGSLVFVSDATGEAQLCVAPRRGACGASPPHPRE